MPAVTCNKCKSGTPAQGDSWCLGCSSQEVTFGVLKRKWNNPGLRSIAEETCLTTARLIKAFANVDSNLITSAAVDKHPQTAPKVKPERRRSRSAEHDPRPPLRRATSSHREAAREPQQEADYGRDSEYTEESEEEEVDKRPDPPVVPPPPPPRPEVKEEARGSRRPAEPDHPPPSHRDYKKREHHHHHSEPGKRKKRKNKKKKRGGSKHQRHYRETVNPFRASHRRLDRSHLSLASSLAEGLSRRY